MNINRSALAFLSGVALAMFAGCAELNDPYGTPYSSPSYGYGNSNDRYEYERRREEEYRRERDREHHRELERERRRLEEERRRLEEERERNNYRPPPPPPPPRPIERCPSGFSPSENKCSTEERRRGCRDMRLPGGLGCVSR